MDRIKQMLDTITELTDEQIVELQSEIVAEFETVEGEDPTPQTVETMTALADMLDTVRGEAKRREAQAQELATRAAEAAMRVKGEAMEDMEAPKEEMPEAEAPEAEKAPEADDAEEDKEDDKAPMGEASTATEVAAELSATTQEVIETSTTAEVAESTPAVEEAPVVAAAEEVAVAEAAETVAEVVEVAEASTTETSTTTAQEEQEGTEATMTAAADMPETTPDVIVEAPADRQPVLQVKETAPVAITAGADIPGYTAGSEIKDMREVAEAFSKRLHGLRRVNGGDGEQHIVASLTTQYPESRQLTSDAESNWAKVQAVSGPEALVASGGHSTPFEVKYDIFGFGVTDRPIRDALPRFSADRGGIRFIVPPVLSDYANAVGVWTAANDAAGSPDPASKTSLTVTSATETTVATDAVTLQLQFGNLMARAYPELIARHNELALIQHAREAEQYLASKLTAGSTAVTSTSLIGVARDYLVQVGRAAAAYRSRHRLDPTAPLRVIAPSWVKDAMVADLALAMPGDNTLNAASEIDGYLAARGVNITFSHDLDVFGAQSAGAMLEFPDSFSWYMFAEGTFLFLDGGTLDLGIIRDSTLVGTNDYKMFVETFEGVAKVGIESLVVTSTISVNGVAAALRDTTGGATAAAIEY
ncbi:major capsid protein [Actinomycetia phage DSL-LC01]|nr:major capsid protein [Actinomycetia phage DSL-LC01]